ncbi:hypothetical protein ACFO5R_11400 [Halosolutus amylolyticus]|uniref:Uncharacterized protein n=1 Tax=Halosolutus amylolyticus TaxID=2932267 RepID=A0ABD5PPZ3_9EURY|nr:hypothetical protein [Halosolutus amylolyticus]
MRGPGIFWMLQTAAGFAISGPIFVVGIGFLRSGDYVAGIGFLALGVATLYFPTYLVNRIGGPRTWIRRRLGGDDEASENAPPDGESDHESERVPVLDRLRDR